ATAAPIWRVDFEYMGVVRARRMVAEGIGIHQRPVRNLVFRQPDYPPCGGFGPKAFLEDWHKCGAILYPHRIGRKAWVATQFGQLHRAAKAQPLLVALNPDRYEFLI